jgi:glycosyltransferase involved in cell wall biosynthesis
MIKAFGSMAEKLEVLPTHGVDTTHFHPLRADETALAEDFRVRFGLKEDFLLTVGNLQPHKNLAILPKALDILRAQGRKTPLLAVVGFGDQKAFKASLPAHFPEDKILCLGYLDEADLYQAYRLAQAYVFPSLYEGFGLPIVEAQASGTPVIYANTTSLPEVAGDGGLPFSPDSPEDLAAKIAAVQDDRDLRKRMVTEGFVQSAKYRWDRAGETFWRVLKEAAES